ncbi:MAG: hypothetical protein GVY31_07410 [Alphaproteobacteria bacterium]|jgi:hypothetical protein|nr:hypothetical protein [Alphaproteobacteria bacterium]
MGIRKRKILAWVTSLFVLLAIGSGLLFYFEGDDEFGGLTGLLGFIFVVFPLSIIAIALLVATISLWAEGRDL